MLQGDLGQSLRNNIAVAQLISEKLPATAILSAMAMGWAVLIGAPAGIVSALYKGRGLDYLANVVGLAGLSVPPFWRRSASQAPSSPKPACHSLAFASSHRSWGASLNAARSFIADAPWMSVWPGAFICFAVFGCNLLGDAVRDVLDPRDV